MSMFEKTEKRAAILDENLELELKEYLGFRRVFRHSYGYQILWEKVKPLFDRLECNWNQVRKSFEYFLESNCDKN